MKATRRSLYLYGGAMGQGQWARAYGEPISANPWDGATARLEWETGWLTEDKARREEARLRTDKAWARRID